MADRNKNHVPARPFTLEEIRRAFKIVEKMEERGEIVEPYTDEECAYPEDELV